VVLRRPASEDRQVLPQLERGDLGAVLLPLLALVAQEVTLPRSDLARSTSMQRWLLVEEALVVIVGHPRPPSDGPQTAPLWGTADLQWATSSSCDLRIHSFPPPLGDTWGNHGPAAFPTDCTSDLATVLAAWGTVRRRLQRLL
jgi:hypothetical protein